jgi:hypothetical protein
MQTWIISGASSPHICTPTTLFVVAHTISFISTRSGNPERVALRGLKFDMKTSTSPYSSIACTNTHMSKFIMCKKKLCMPCIITCSSVRPTCPMGGWEKTAAGTALSKEGNDEKAFDRRYNNDIQYQIKRSISEAMQLRL